MAYRAPESDSWTDSQADREADREKSKRAFFMLPRRRERLGFVTAVRPSVYVQKVVYEVRSCTW